jgi:hypothetical protein
MRIYRTESNVVFEYLYQVYKTMLRESRQDIWTMVYRMCKGGGGFQIYMTALFGVLKFILSLGLVMGALVTSIISQL